MIDNNTQDAYNLQGQLQIGGVSANELAEKYGTPLYVYDETKIKKELFEWKVVLANFPKTSICYAVKANGNLNILKYFWNAGVSFDIVSGGELARLQKIGVSGSRIIFSGVGKSKAEIEMALAANIRCFNVESESEIAMLAEIAVAHGVKIPLAVRVNPDIDAKTHPYISTGLTDNKFGLSVYDTLRALGKYRGTQYLDWQGLDCHIGSNMHDPQPYCSAAQSLIDLTLKLKKQNINIQHLDCGGGIGVCYKPRDKLPKVADFINPVFEMVNDAGLDVELIFEPGRRLIAQSGYLLTRVEHIKNNQHKNFIIVDAAMTELARPSLYGAYHEIIHVNRDDKTSQKSQKLSDIVGPVCESSDFLAKDRQITAKAGDLLAIKTVGAYGFVMSNNYNARPRAAEVLLENGRDSLIRSRESYDDLFRHEIISEK